MALITKYSDFVINPVQFFIDLLTDALTVRDLPGLTSNMVQAINISKEHPIVTMMANKLSDSRRGEIERSNILPSIGITPGSPKNIAFTLAKSYKPEVVDDAFIATLRSWYDKDMETIQRDLLITQKQIDLIIAAYRRNPARGVRCIKNEWHKNEEINVSLWSEAPDVDIIIGMLLDSIFSDFQVGNDADTTAKIRNMDVNVTKGLTNFNFGRVLYGTEYSLTFMNSYCNYLIYTDAVIDAHTLQSSVAVPGETAAEWRDEIDEDEI